jgi:uncharacterized SAM-binding protein YcdF (DUF218 family)
VLAMAITLLALLVLLVPLVAAFHVSREANQDDRVPTDAIVVLGAAQFDGEPSPVLRTRLDHAAQLYRDGVAPTIITVGGNQPGDRYTEAEAGRNYLISQGVSAGSVIAVGVGNDTIDSLKAVANQMAGLGSRSATIVSDPTHMARSLAIADRLGIDAHGSPTASGDGTQVTAEYVAREATGFLFFLINQQWSVPRVITPQQG